MRLVLIQPPVRDFYNTDVRLQPLGLAYLKAALTRYLPEVQVIIRDFHHGGGRQTVPLPDELADLAEFYPVPDRSPFSVFHQFYHFGRSFEAIEDDLAALQPDVVGISALFTAYHREALEVARRVKRRLGVPVVLGGSHVSAAPESVLSDPNVDFVIRGEGERPVVELLRHLLGRQPVEAVSNLGYKVAGCRRFNPLADNYAVDKLPHPDLSDFSPEDYRLAGKPMTFLITSRSCPHKCSFCSVHTTFGQRYRRRSVGDVLSEIELRYAQGYRVIDFEDDNLTYYGDEFKTLCRALTERFPRRELEFVAMNGISYLSLDQETLELMRRAGFTQLNLALVSSDKTVRWTTKRPHTIEAYLRVVDHAARLGFKVVSYQILGLPNESLDSMVQTLAFNARLPVLLGASPFYRTPDMPIARGLHLTERDYVRARLTAMGVDTDGFDREDIYTLFVTTRILNFLKGLDLDGAAEFTELAARSWPDSRTQTGFEQLARLAETGILLARTKTRWVENRKFRAGVFLGVLAEAEQIMSLRGAPIDLRRLRAALARSITNRGNADGSLTTFGKLSLSG